MTTAPVPSIDGRAGARPGDLRLWWAALMTAVVLTALYELLLDDANPGRHILVWTIASFGAGIAIVAGVRRYRPVPPWSWLCFAGGVLAFATGDLIGGTYEVRTGGVPFPSLADAFYLAGYPLFAAGFLLAARARQREANLRFVTDTLTIAVVGTLVLWVYVAAPIVHDDELTLYEKLLSVAYPAGDMLLLGTAGWLLVGSRLGSRSMRILALGPACTFVADVSYYAGSGGAWFVDGLLMAGNVCYALAALHPSMVELTSPEQEETRGDDRGKLVLVGISALVPIALVAVQAVRGEELFLPAVFITVGLLVFLGIVRVDSMLRDADQASERDATLARFTTELLSGDGNGQLVVAADASVKQLVSRGGVYAVGAAQNGGAGLEHTFVAPVRVGSDTVAEVVADVGRRELARTHSVLESVASQLAMGLEREHLLERERDHSEELFEQNERLMELDDMKNRLVSSTSHELRTPLTSMVGYLELVLDEEVGPLNDEQRDFLEIVQRNSDRLNKLVDDLLFVGRADAGRLKLEPETVDLARIASAAVQSSSAAAARKGVEVGYEGPDSALPLLGDSTRLAQMIDNLVSNSVKFTPEGGSVTVEVGADEEAVLLTVRDTGVGIPADELPHIFERFFRASTTATMPGSGIGLSIVFFIAEAHGGSISVESDVGEGTTFTVTLPLHPPADALVSRAAAERTTT